MIKPFITSLRILTILPVPGKDTDNFCLSLPFFPVVGYLIGACVYGVFHGAMMMHVENVLFVAGIALALETVITGGLHLDGLGDVADGFGSGKVKEGILAILKDPRMGAFGVIAIVFDIVCKIVCWQELYTEGGFGVILFSIVCGRGMQAVSLALIPAARPGGLLATFGHKTALIRIGTIISVIASFALGLYYLLPLQVMILSLAGLVAAALFTMICMKKINGITGDCVGAVNELAEMAVLVTGVIFYSML